ncbi:unnamed protein product [Lasius platythorax]|uniref:Uncharacterized protein n=1 Tax=Lasius platythorax TaxID=488582 RepID=A0AAV2N2V1_9HYME
MYTCAEGDGYEGHLVVRPSVCPAIGYRRDVTDFTGGRANEKLVGCEVARGQRLHPPSFLSPRSHPSPFLSPPSGHPHCQLLLSDIPTVSQLPRARRSKYPAREISLVSITGSLATIASIVVEISE